MGIEGIFVFLLIRALYKLKANLVRGTFHFLHFKYRALGGSFPAHFLFSNFLSFSSTFSATKHPLRMTTQRMVG